MSTAEWWCEVTHPLQRADSSDPALIEASTGRVVSHRELGRLVAEHLEELGDVERRLVFLGATPTVVGVVRYLALTAARATVAMLDPRTPDTVLRGWIDSYQPDAIIGFDGRPEVWGTDQDEAGPTGGESILLPTSGSTGSPKFVRLSFDAVSANARQIVDALGIKSGDRALAHLPLFYSFGLSILNSHLLAGASVVLTGASAVRPEFWNAISEHAVTSLSGVPYSFELFRRMGFAEMSLPSLRDVTQAGGRLPTERITEIHSELDRMAIRFWVMYGQTEATARISVLPAEDLPEHAGSVGFALPGGSIDIVDPDGGGSGEIRYRGPNVMLGYATDRDDLNGMDNTNGILNTGDLGFIDSGGRLRITGRMKRIAKVFGTRVSLDDVEAQLVELGHRVAAIDNGDGLTVFVEAPTDVSRLSRRLEQMLEFPPRSIQAVPIDSIPLTGAGKTDYSALSRLGAP